MGRITAGAIVDLVQKFHRDIPDDDIKVPDALNTMIW